MAGYFGETCCCSTFNAKVEFKDLSGIFQFILLTAYPEIVQKCPSSAKIHISRNQRYKLLPKSKNIPTLFNTCQFKYKRNKKIHDLTMSFEIVRIGVNLRICTDTSTARNSFSSHPLFCIRLEKYYSPKVRFFFIFSVSKDTHHKIKPISEAAAVQNRLFRPSYPQAIS